MASSPCFLDEEVLVLQEFQESTEVDKEEVQPEEEEEVEEEEEEVTRQTAISQQSPLTSQKQDTKVSITRPISLLAHPSHPFHQSLGSPVPQCESAVVRLTFVLLCF